MIDKSELLRRMKEVVASDEYTMPLYLGHLLQTLPWYGLPADMEETITLTLGKIKRETEDGRQISVALYAAIQGNSAPQL